MNERIALLPPPQGSTDAPRDAADRLQRGAADRLQRGAAELAGRVGQALGPAHPASSFLAALAEVSQRPAGDGRSHPVDRYAAALGLARHDIDLLLLAGLAEAHEGLAALLRDLHPRALPAATTGLFGVLAECGLVPGLPAGPVGRTAARAAICDSPLLATGAVRLGAGPFWERSLDLAECLWSALLGEPTWPPEVAEIAVPTGLVSSGLRAEDPAVGAVLRAVTGSAPVTVQVRGDDPPGNAVRLSRLLAGAGARPVVLAVPTLDAAVVGSVWAVACARGLVPILVPGELDDTGWPSLPGPVLLARQADVERPRVATAVLTLDVAPLGPSGWRTLWSGLLADVAGVEQVVPVSVGVVAAATLARDVNTAAVLTGRRVVLDELRAAVGRARGAARGQGGTRVRPTARWSDLVLPEPRINQLQEAVSRVRQADTVLNKWGFLSGRPGRHGVRLLFCGPPGTGKTLAAEVLAAEIGRDLLVVDLSRTVSKWIGETEKNLAAAFDAAERGEYLLLFDEADALFAKRTEVGDARDRYANLETAYLLSRLSWFDGVAVLATNLRQNLDVAFGRRLEYVIPFDLPDPGERARLWRAHLPRAAPLAPDVDLVPLADFYPITGSLIRNAAVGAAYLAAGDGAAIATSHLVCAVQREYVKAGLAFPGPPPPNLSTSPVGDLSCP